MWKRFWYWFFLKDNNASGCTSRESLDDGDEVEDFNVRIIKGMNGFVLKGKKYNPNGADYFYHRVVPEGGDIGAEIQVLMVSMKMGG